MNRLTPSQTLLRELIAIPSVNSAFLPPNDPRVGEQGVADFLAATAAQAGLVVELQKVFPRRCNLLVRYVPHGQPRQRILLAPHLDTVGEPALSPALFDPRLRGDRLFGRGACDTKGSVASMLTALIAVAKARQRPMQTEIVFAGLVDEEFGQGGSRALAASGVKADLAIVGEPTQLRVVTAHKGDLWLQLETKGKPAHGSRPELGRNAVHAMARVVELLETEYANELRQRRHPLLGHATVNVGTISGGTQPNIVPPWCSIKIDRRTLPGETLAAVTREIRRLLHKHKQRVAFMNLKNEPCSALETDPNLPLVRQFFKTAGQASACGVHFFCDAAVLAHSGIPSIVFGPGDIAQAHTADEWVSLRSVERATSMLIGFLQSLP